MPIYEYECKSCGVYEINHKISEPARTQCATCGGEIRRLISTTSFALKGGGWYSDGYGSSGKNNAAVSGDTGGTEKKEAPAASCGAGACGTGGCGTAEA